MAGRLVGLPVRAVIESMNGVRFVHDTLEEHGWEVLVADAQKVKGLTPPACKSDRNDAGVVIDGTVRGLDAYAEELRGDPPAAFPTTTVNSRAGRSPQET